MIVTPYSFKFKGERQYVQGPDLFTSLIESVNTKDIEQIRFSIHDFIWNTNCKIMVLDKSDEVYKTLPVRCTMIVNGSQLKMGITPDENRKSKDLRYKYDEDRIIKYCNFQSEKAMLMNESPYSFIETIVAMKKEMLNRTYPEADGKWAFTQLRLDHYFDKREHLGLKVKSKIGLRLIRSSILYKNNIIGDIFFSLVGK